MRCRPPTPLIDEEVKGDPSLFPTPEVRAEPVHRDALRPEGAARLDQAVDQAADRQLSERSGGGDEHADRTEAAPAPAPPRLRADQRSRDRALAGPERQAVHPDPERHQAVWRRLRRRQCQPRTSTSASSSRCWGRPAAARPRCCACWPASRRRPRGRILIDGQDMAAVPPWKRPANMMFQSYALFPHMSVADNIAFGLKQDGVPKGEIQRPGRRGGASWSSSRAARSAGRTSSPAARSSAWRSPARSSSGPRCCCSTSRWVRWTRSCASGPSSSWSTSRRAWA